MDPPEHPWTWKFFGSSYNEGIFHMEPVDFVWAQIPDSSHQFQINLSHGINSKFQLIPKDPNSFFPDFFHVGVAGQLQPCMDLTKFENKDFFFIL